MRGEFKYNLLIILPEKVKGEGVGEARNGDAVADQALRDRGAEETGRVRDHGGRRDGDQAGHFHSSIRAD